MKILEKNVPGHERVLVGEDQEAGYRGIIAIHNTALGPALGGTRLWRYDTDEEGLTDVLRLSRGMSYKNALADLPLGGGKSIIFAPEKILNRETLFRAHGRFIETLGGSYITAEDVATTTEDMGFVSLETRHVTGLAERSGDPSPVTAHGVCRAILAAAKYRWSSEDVTGKTIAIQGCGSVGYHLAMELHQSGAKLIVTDIAPERARRVVEDFGALNAGEFPSRSVGPEPAMIKTTGIGELDCGRTSVPYKVAVGVSIVIGSVIKVLSAERL